MHIHKPSTWCVDDLLTGKIILELSLLSCFSSIILTSNLHNSLIAPTYSGLCTCDQAAPAA